MSNELRHIQQREATTLIAGLVVEAYRLKGVYFREEYPLGSVAVDTYNLIMEDHPGTTIDIIKDAFHNGIKGRYGDVAGLPPTTLAGFVDSWYKSRRGVNVQQIEEKPVLQLQRDKRANTINLLQSMYDLHRQKCTTLAMPTKDLIEFLWNEDKLLNVKPDGADFKKYVEKARGSVGRTGRLVRSVDEDSDGNLIKDIYIQKNPTDESEIISKAYKLAIFDFFDDCAKMDINDLHELFTTTQNPF